LQVAARLVEHLREEPTKWGLLAILEILVEPELDLSEFEPPPLPPEVPAHIARADAFLRILADKVEDIPLHDLLARTEVQLGWLAWQIARRPIHERTGTYLEGILAYIDAMPLDDPDRENLPEHKASVLDALRSVELRTALPAFDSPDAWSSYQLRGPWLEPPQHLRPPRLRSISELTNIRLFKTTPTIDVDFPIPQGDVGQWIVLIGENGVGKTTLLRSLALALATPAVASKLLDEQVSMVRNGGEGRIAIELDTGTLSVTVSRGDRTEHVEASEATTVVDRPWVVGYGVRRHNARGNVSSEEGQASAIGELHLLFEGPASPRNVALWLEKLEAEALREQVRSGRGSEPELGPHGQIWSAVRHALQTLIGIRDLKVEQGPFDKVSRIYVTHETFGRVRLDALSDGYLTTVGWVSDMIARWIDRQRELDEPVGSDVLHQMTGFVLIDEIDLHLHPTWQLTILDDIRRLFPRMSFVVTTHNPLTLHGARPGEIYVMRHTEGGGIELVQRDIRPGHDVDRVLFDQFGVKATFDAETRKLLDEHSALVLRGVSRDDVRRVELERRLRARFGGLTGTIEDERERVLGPSRPRPREQVERALARYPKRSKPGIEGQEGD
jgi:energy-coupling factor transporter ATP-binding protein EcfA2